MAKYKDVSGAIEIATSELDSSNVPEKVKDEIQKIIKPDPRFYIGIDAYKLSYDSYHRFGLRACKWTGAKWVNGRQEGGFWLNGKLRFKSVNDIDKMIERLEDFKKNFDEYNK